jgi:hypothetical protein
LIFLNINSEILDITNRLKSRNVNQQTFLAGGNLQIQEEKIENISNRIYKQPIQQTSKMQVSNLNQNVFKRNTRIQIEPQPENEPTQVINQEVIETNEPTPLNETTTDNIKEARTHSIKFSKMTGPIDLKNIKTSAEWTGYMDNLSYNEGGWSDFRLPLDKSNFTPLYSGMTSEMVDSFMNGFAQKGGIRKYKQTKKNRKQSKKMTRKNHN